MMVIKAMKEALEECPRGIRICTKDCRSLLSHFDIIEFKHVSRNKNKAAHATILNFKNILPLLII